MKNLFSSNVSIDLVIQNSSEDFRKVVDELCDLNSKNQSTFMIEKEFYGRRINDDEYILHKTPIFRGIYDSKLYNEIHIKLFRDRLYIVIKDHFYRFLFILLCIIFSISLLQFILSFFIWQNPISKSFIWGVLIINMVAFIINRIIFFKTIISVQKEIIDRLE